MGRILTGFAAALAVLTVWCANSTSLGTKALPLSQAAPATGNVLLRHLENSGAALVNGTLYVWQQTNPVGIAGRTKLMRVNPVNGRVLVTRQLGLVGIGYWSSGSMVSADGWLWVAGVPQGKADGLGGWLLKLQPQTLAVKSRIYLSGAGTAPHVVLAGGWLWVCVGDRLYRISPHSGRITVKISLGGANSSDMSSSATGQQILVSEANDGIGAIELRSATTGALVDSTSPADLGVFAPTLSQVVDGGVWLSQATGMMGHIERLDASTLSPTPISLPSAAGDATNDITAEVLAGVLYVQQLGGGPDLNYCGDPTTGQIRAPLELPSDATLLTASATYLYYIPDSGSPKGQELARRAINPLCLG
jgi:hypothetical protein